MRCRLCFWESQNKNPSILFIRVTFNVLELVEKHLRLKLFDDGQLFICPNCRHQLKRYDNFYEMVHEKQKIFEKQKIGTINVVNFNTLQNSREKERFRGFDTARNQKANLSSLNIFEINELQKEPEKVNTVSPDVLPNQLLNVDIFEIKEIEEYSQKENPVTPTIPKPVNTNVDTFEITIIKEEPEKVNPLKQSETNLDAFTITEIQNDLINENMSTKTIETAPNTSDLATLDNEELQDSKKSSEKLNETESEVLLNIKYEIDEEEFVPVDACIDAQLVETQCSNADESETHDTDARIKVRNEAVRPQTKEEEELEKLLAQQKKPQKRNRAKRNTKEYRLGDKIIAENIDLKCYRCNDNVTFKLFNELKAHYRQHHEGMEGYVTCCARNIYNRTELLDHIKFHTDPEIYKCSVCDKKFLSRKYMKNHITREHKNDEDWKYHCTFCNKGFPWLSSLRTHMDCHKSEKSHVCDYCGAGFHGHYRLRSHIRTVHTKDYKPPTNIECKLCGVITGSRTSFGRHMKKHMTKQTDDKTNEAIPIKCNYCEKSFKSEKLCKTHIIGVHIPRGSNAHFV